MSHGKAIVLAVAVAAATLFGVAFWGTVGFAVGYTMGKSRATTPLDAKESRIQANEQKQPPSPADPE